MYKKYTHLLTLSTFLAVSLVSCKDKEMYDISISQDAPALVDGHLKFSSLNAFQAFIKSNQDKTVEQLMQMNKDMSFVSHLRLSSEPGVKAPRPVYPSTLHCLNTQKALTAKTLVAKTTGATTNSFGAGDGQSNEPVDYMPPVDLIGVDIVDPLLDSVLDENRELGINSIIYRAGNDYCFFYPVGHPELIGLLPTNSQAFT